MEIVNTYAGKWIRVVTNMQAGCYEVYTSQADFPPPTWPAEGFRSLMEKAFKGKVIDRLDHPLIRQLKGVA